MKKILKKKYMMLLLTAVLAMQSSQALASSGLFTDIIGLIRNTFALKTESVLEETEQEIAQIGADRSKELKDYIYNTYAQTMAEIEAYKNTELARGRKEIDDYIGDFKNQMDLVVIEEKNKLQHKITDTVDKEVDKIKKDLNKDIEKNIKDLLK